MKAILVIDMPVNGCESCMFDIYGKCLVNLNTGAKQCPLKPMPQYQQYRYSTGAFTRGFTKGWNTCIKEITGETE